MASGLPVRHRRIRFRSWHRGSREAYILLGRFCDQHLSEMKEEDLEQFEALLEQPDPDIWNWVIGRQKIPADFDHTVMRRLKKYATNLKIQ